MTWKTTYWIPIEDAPTVFGKEKTMVVIAFLTAAFMAVVIVRELMRGE